MLRKAAVSGFFYPSSPIEAGSFISANISDTPKAGAYAVMVPHAGWIYSGRTAVNTLSRVLLPKTAVLLGPNHTGLGATVSVYPSGSWETPFGNAEIDENLAFKLTSNPLCTADTIAHLNEHSLEVIVPILKFLKHDIKIVPITMKGISLDACREFGHILSDVCGNDVIVIISSDMNHFEDEAATVRKDEAALQAILALDENTLAEKVHKLNISMCGVIPAATGIIFSKDKGCIKTELIQHTHSGFISGEYDRVVGYAGVIFNK